MIRSGNSPTGCLAPPEINKWSEMRFYYDLFHIFIMTALGKNFIPDKVVVFISRGLYLCKNCISHVSRARAPVALACFIRRQRYSSRLAFGEMSVNLSILNAIRITIMSRKNFSGLRRAGGFASSDSPM